MENTGTVKTPTGIWHYQIFDNTCLREFAEFVLEGTAMEFYKQGNEIIARYNGLEIHDGEALVRKSGTQTYFMRTQDELQKLIDDNTPADVWQKRIAELEAEVARYEWQSGHPEHENDVLVHVRGTRSNGETFTVYEVDNWSIEKNNFEFYGGWEVLAWSEIRPWKGE